MAFHTQRKHLTPTGATLNLYVSTPATVRGIVQINHGLAEHAARYARFADFLTQRGFAVYAHDHRGHGLTTAPGAPLGSFGPEPAAGNVTADVASIHELIAAEHTGLPVIIFGHSMGSLITLNVVLKHAPRVAGAAIWNGNFSAGLLGRAAQAILAWERFRLGSDVPSRLLPKLTFDDWARKVTDNRTAFDWLSRDEAEVDKYVADPLCGWNASVGMWRTVFDFIFTGADDGNFGSVPKDLPFNLVGGEKDPATNGGKAVEDLAGRMKRMGFSNLHSKVYAATRHESLNEVNRDLVMQKFAEWAEGVVAGSHR